MREGYLCRAPPTAVLGASSARATLSAGTEMPPLIADFRERTPVVVSDRVTLTVSQTRPDD